MMNRLSLLLLLVLLVAIASAERWEERQTINIPREEGEYEIRLQQRHLQRNGNGNTDAPASDPPTETTGAPTDSATDAITSSPTDSATDAPTDGPVVTGAPTEAPVAMSAAPSEAPSGAPSEPPIAITNAPTEAATEVQVTQSPTEEVSMEASECQTETHEVMIDIQIDYPDGTTEEQKKCTDAQQQVIARTIKDTMNNVDVFNQEVPTWLGEDDAHPVFGDVDFDVEQEIDTTVTSRRLRGRGDNMLEAAKRLIANGHRWNQVLDCPLRGSGRPCLLDRCLWGCLEGVVEDCDPTDENDPKDWKYLKGPIKTALNALEYDCLGSVKEVEVTLEEGETEAPTSAPEEVRNIAPEPERHHYDDTGTPVTITTIVQMSYFDRSGGEIHESSPDEQKVKNQLLEEYNYFTETVLKKHAEYSEIFNGVLDSDVHTSWDEPSRVLTCTFKTIAYFNFPDGQEPYTDHQVSHVIATEGNFHDYTKLLRNHKCEGGVNQHLCNTFMSGIKAIEFTQTGTGARV